MHLPKIIKIPNGSISKIITYLNRKGLDVGTVDKYLVGFFGSPQNGWIDIKKDYLTKGDLEVRCDVLKVFIKKGIKKIKKFQNKETSKKENIEKIVALGGVKIKQKDRSGSCNKATYLSKEDLLILEGKAILIQGKNMVKGDKIKVYLSQDRTEVIGEKHRVEVIFYPKTEKKNRKR